MAALSLSVDPEREGSDLSAAATNSEMDDMTRSTFEVRDEICCELMARARMQ